MTVDDVTHSASTMPKQTSKKTSSPYSLLRSVEEWLQFSSLSALFDSVVKNTAILDVQDRQMKGSTSHDHKVKSLLS